MVYHEKALNNYFIPCHGKYSGQHNQCDIHAEHDGKVGCSIFEYTTAFLHSDWMYFLWLGIKVDTYEKLLVWTARHIKYGKCVRKRHIFLFEGDQAALPCFCVSLLSKVITGALNFERLTNGCCTIYTINCICLIKIARVDQALKVIIVPYILLAVFRV